MAEFQPDPQLLRDIQSFLTRLAASTPAMDGQKAVLTFAKYMIHLDSRLASGLALILPSEDRTYEYANLRYHPDSWMLQIQEESGVREIFYKSSHRVLFEALISRPETLWPYEELFAVLAIADPIKGMNQLRTMRGRVRQLIGDKEHKEDTPPTWDLLQTVHGSGLVLMRRELFLQSEFCSDKS